MTQEAPDPRGPWFAFDEGLRREGHGTTDHGDCMWCVTVARIRAAEVKALEWAANSMKYAECAGALGCEQRGNARFHGPSCRQEDIDEIRAEIDRRKGEVYPKPNPQPVCFMTDGCNCGAHDKPSATEVEE